MRLALLVPVCFVFFSRVAPAAAGQSLTSAIHRTQAATERVNDLWCYDCDTADHGAACVDVAATSARNASAFARKCKDEEFVCMVKRFSYTTSNENATSAPRMWSLGRRCAANCEAGCIVIGERTKLYACTACCEESLCNVGRGGAPHAGGLARTGIGIGIALLGLALWGLPGGCSAHRHRRAL